MNKQLAIKRSRHSVLLEAAEIVEGHFVAAARDKEKRLGRQKPTYTPSRNWDWTGIAAFIFSNGLPIAEWVDYVVEHNRQPRPSLLKSPKQVNRFKETAAERREEILRRIHTELEASKAIASTELSSTQEASEAGVYGKPMTKAEIVINVLANQLHPFADMFRYCWAVEQGMKKCEEDFFVPALCQYAVSPQSYDEVYGKWIPEAFKQYARRIFTVRT